MFGDWWMRKYEFEHGHGARKPPERVTEKPPRERWERAERVERPKREERFSEVQERIIQEELLKLLNDERFTREMLEELGKKLIIKSSRD